MLRPRWAFAFDELGLVLELVGRGAQTRGNHTVFEEASKAALANGFASQIFGRAAIGKHSNPRDRTLIRAAGLSVPHLTTMSYDLLIHSFSLLSH